MEKIVGKSVQNGIAIGKIKIYEKTGSIVKRTHIDSVLSEKKRLEEALKKTQEQLHELYEKAEESAGSDSAAIFEIHQMMLEDEDYLESIMNIIENESVNAEYAVSRTKDIFSEMFASMEDEYMRARAADVRDVSDRLIDTLDGKTKNSIGKLEEKVILLADDLTPSETIQLDKSKIQAFVTVHGSMTSHTAILARTMNIPALVGVSIEDISKYDQEEAIVDGKNGVLYIAPDEEIQKQMQTRMEEEEMQKKLLSELKGKETVSKTGKKIHLYANVGSIGDIAFAQASDAEGIGLFRSEFLYLDKTDYPTEEEQFQVYKQAVQLMGKKKVIIRTCDIGADKQIDYFQMEKEENPALGYRAIRICLDRIDFFKTQLRALFRASAYGNLAIMYPMIISMDEVRKIKSIVEEVKEELREAGIAFQENIEQGIMIETPAAALISDQLAKEVDFFSVGTNDLTQYTLAIDRQNEKLEGCCDTHHPALLKLIKYATDNAHANGKWIGICGELAADLSLTETFLEMGIDELSVSPGMVLKVRKKVLEL